MGRWSDPSAISVFQVMAETNKVLAAVMSGEEVELVATLVGEMLLSTLKSESSSSPAIASPLVSLGLDECQSEWWALMSPSMIQLSSCKIWESEAEYPDSQELDGGM